MNSHKEPQHLFLKKPEPLWRGIRDCILAVLVSFGVMGLLALVLIFIGPRMEFLFNFLSDNLLFLTLLTLLLAVFMSIVWFGFKRTLSLIWGIIALWIALSTALFWSGVMFGF